MNGDSSATVTAPDLPPGPLPLHELQPGQAPLALHAVTQGQAHLLAMIDVVDRHGNTYLRLPVTQWPVTIGRDLHADLVLDDPHVAARHLQLQQHAPGKVQVRVLETDNGAALGRRHHGRDALFDWPAGQQLTVGRQHLRLRLADTPVPAEQRMPQGPWRATLWSLASLALAMLVMLTQGWFRSTDAQKVAQELPVLLIGALAGLAAWAGLWALATKLFSGHAQFWRHVRIASLAYVASVLFEFAAQVVTFAFSWESLGRFAFLATILIGAFGIYRHLLVVAPQPRRGLAAGVALVVLLGVPLLLGTQWLKNKRLSNQLYMAKLFPPDWRVAKPVPVATFLQQASSIEKRLATRLTDRREEEAADEAPEEE